MPAEEAEVSLVDRIFVRSGAADNITGGMSTFMVEMVEAAHILHQATSQSLVIMDELGRGASTYDGISIAWAIAEHFVTQSKRRKVLFATHYHELQHLEHDFPNAIKNFHVAVEEENYVSIFLYTVRAGAAPHSFGIAVAQMAGIEQQIIVRARELLSQLESVNTNATPQYPNKKRKKVAIQPERTAIAHWEDLLLKADLNAITPLAAHQLLFQLQQKIQEKK